MFGPELGEAPRPWHGSRSRCLGDRSRAMLAWGLTCFVVFQLAYLFVLECWRPDLRDPEYGCRLALLRSQHSPGRPLIVALGSSRTELAFRPDLLENYTLPNGEPVLCFNFGVPAAGPVQELVTLERLLAAGVHPRWVLIEVLPIFLHTEGSMDSLLCVTDLGWRDLRRVRRYCSNPQDIYRRWCMDEAAAWFSHRLCFMNCYAPNWLPMECRQDGIWHNLDSYGWLPCRTPATSQAEYRRYVERVRRQLGPLFPQFAISTVCDRCLHDLLELCHQEGVGAVLVLMPETSEFKTWYPPGVEVKVEAYLDRLSRQYRVPVINASRWVNDREFLDAHHLLASGAHVFTERLGREVLQPLLAGKPLPVVERDQTGPTTRSYQ